MRESRKILFVGGKLSHSVLPKVYEQLSLELPFTIETVNYTVGAFPRNKGALMDVMASARAAGVCVTLPHKIAALEPCDKLLSAGSFAQSVNVLKLENAEVLVGDNTDGIGFLRFAQRKGIDFKHKRVLILGAGGVARSVISTLITKQLQCQLYVSNRSAAPLKELHLLFPEICISEEFIQDQSFDIVINTTSSSLNIELPPIPPHAISRHTYCLESAYLYKKKTIFEKYASSHHALFYSNGIGMLIEQAMSAIPFWFTDVTEVDYSSAYSAFEI